MCQSSKRSILCISACCCSSSAHWAMTVTLLAHVMDCCTELRLFHSPPALSLVLRVTQCKRRSLSYSYVLSRMYCETTLAHLAISSPFATLTILVLLSVSLPPFFCTIYWSYLTWKWSWQLKTKIKHPNQHPRLLHPLLPSLLSSSTIQPALITLTTVSFTCFLSFFS